MGWWRVNADTLATGRFAISPLAETLAALIVLHAGTAGHDAERAWLDAHLGAYRDRLAADPVTADLLRAAFGYRWVADFITTPPTGETCTPPTGEAGTSPAGEAGTPPAGEAGPPAGATTPPTGDGWAAFSREVNRIRRTPPAQARADLVVSRGGPLPARLDRDDLPDRAADLLEWVWLRTVAPDWPRRYRILQADVVARTQQVSLGGWAAALDGMRPGMRWLGDARLQINTYDRPPREISGARLVFVPVTPRCRGWVSWDPPHRYAVVYPCAGVLAEAGPVPDRTPVPEPLARLLGPGRAAVLMLLDTPKSTTHVVALTGQPLGSVGRHLRVLFDARLITRRRAGRSVLYYRTGAGNALVAAQRD